MKKSDISAHRQTCRLWRRYMFMCSCKYTREKNGVAGFCVTARNVSCKIRALQQGAQDQGSCEEIKMLGSGIEICCKSTTGSLRSRFLWRKNQCSGGLKSAANLLQGLRSFFFFSEAEISLQWRIEICCKSTYHRELMKVLVKKKRLQWRIETLWVSLLQNPFCSLEITCIDAAAASS